MGNFSWRSALLNQTSYTVRSGEQHLNLRRCYRNADGPPVFMVAGVQQCSDIFWPDTPDAGLAPFLADCGFDVYVAELRGKGISWPQVGRASDWGVSELIQEDIPAHLAKVAKLRPGVPQFWLGHGVGSLLLSASYARLDIVPAPIMGMVHFAAARRCELSSLSKSIRYGLWQLTSGCIGAGTGVSSLKRINADSRKVLKELQVWHSDADWLDAQDGYSYRERLRLKQMPPSVYYSLAGERLWGGVADTRLWMQELGDHDAQLLSLGKRNGNKRDYTDVNMLTHVDACDDHFQHLFAWMQRTSRLYNSQSAHLAQA